MRCLAFDASPLVHFTRAGRLPVLERVTASWKRVVPRSVLDEITKGVFANYARRLGSGPRNIGEAETLAWAETNAAIAVVDDAAARTAGRERGVHVHGTLWLIFEAYNEGLFERGAAEDLIGRLADTDARFPCSPAEAFEWAAAQDLLRR